MQDGRFSTIRFNEWICVTAQYEKAVARIGRQVYQGFSRGLVTDFTSLEMCREISDTFAEAREIRADLEEELERDALDGLNVEESKVADEHRKLTQAQVTKRNFKLKMTKFLGRQSINRSLAAHRDRVKELSRDLGLRALAVHQDEPVLKVRGHRALCRLAERLNDDADQKWQEIVAVNNSGGGGLSFHTILLNFVGNFANFSKGTAIGKFLLKFFKYDEHEEQEKLSKQYEGSTTAEALQAQMEEIEEPHLDVGREIDNMQQEYEETPEEWNLPQSEEAYAAESFEATPNFEPEPVEKWEPQADTWNPDAGGDDDFLDVVADAPDFPDVPVEETPEPAPPPAGPTLLRRRPEPEAESWADSSNEGPAPAPNLPQVGMSAPSQTETASSDQSDDWGWGDDSSGTDDWAQSTPAEDPFAAPAQAEDPFAPPSVAAEAPQAAQEEVDPFAQYQQESEPAPAALQAPPVQPSSPPAFGETASSGWDTGSPEPEPFERQRPPFQRQSSQPAPPPTTPPPAAVDSKPPFVKSKPKEAPLGDWNPEDSFGGANAPKKAQPAASDGWGTTTENEDYGWGSPAASSAPTAKEPEPDLLANASSPADQPAVEEESFPPAFPAAATPSLADEGLASQGPPAMLDGNGPALSPASSGLESSPMVPPATSEAAPMDDDDPILRLLPKDEAPVKPPSPSFEDDNLGDDLLPDFLRERKDEESPVDSGFIPELPSFLESDDGPSLEIVPFGSTPDATSKKPESDDGERTEPFIPELPDL